MTLKRNAQTGEVVFASKPGDTPLQLPKWTEQRTSVASGAASDRVILPTDSDIVELTATENCYINFGDNTVVASTVIASDESRLFLAGVQVVQVPAGATHIAAIQDATAGLVQIEKVE